MGNNKRQYRYAYVKDSKEVYDILNPIEVEDSKEFECINCGGQMVRKKGDKRTHHFSHFRRPDNCSFETYLHKIGKIRLFETLNNALNKKQHYYINFKQKAVCKACSEISSDGCEFDNEVRSINILKKYSEVHLEKKIGNFIPDVSLTSLDDYLYFEIVVSNPPSKKKISSGSKMILIKIKSEKDVAQLEKNKLNIALKDLVNINLDPYYVNFHNTEKCKHMDNWLLIYQDGRSVYLCQNRNTYPSCRDLIFQWSFRNKFMKYDEYITNINFARERLFGEIRNCIICEYHTPLDQDGCIKPYSNDIHCFYHNKSMRSSDGYFCDSYKSIPLRNN